MSESHRRAGQDAFAKIAELVGKKLEVDPATLEAVNGRVQVAGNPEQERVLEGSLLADRHEAAGGERRTLQRGTKSPLSSSQVGGVQMAHVEVDKETGVVKMKKFVAVQDMGLVISPQQAESQINGAIIMGIAYALFEQRINDPETGAFVNADLANYKLCRAGRHRRDRRRALRARKRTEPRRHRPRRAAGHLARRGHQQRRRQCPRRPRPPLPLTPQRVLAALKKAKA